MDLGHDDPHAGLPDSPFDQLSEGSDDDDPKSSGFINEGEGISADEDETTAS